MKANVQAVTNTKVLHARECVEFDPKNKKHRSAFAVFKQTGQWPVDAPMFVLEKPHLSIPLMIAQKLLEHYMKKEFVVVH